MKRLCFLGNSHLASFKLGWDKISASHADTEFTFFGGPGYMMKHAKPIDGMIRPGTAALADSFRFLSGGKDYVDPAEYDAFYIVAQFGLPRIALLVKRHTPEWSSYPGGSQLVSDDCFDTLVENFAHEQMAFVLAKKLSQVTAKPIYIIPEPMLSIKTAHGSESNYWKKLLSYGVGPELVSYYNELSKKLSGPQTKVLAQPIETTDGGLFTRSEFARGAVALREGLDRVTSEEDYAHMNGDYGAAFLKLICAG